MHIFINFLLCSPTFNTTPHRVLNLASLKSKPSFRIAYSQFSSCSSLFKGRFWCLLFLGGWGWGVHKKSFLLCQLPLLSRRECQDHPRNHKVEEKHWVHHQRLAVGRLAVGEEGRGRKGRPAEGRRHHREPHSKADRSGAAEQDDPAHDHGHRQRHDAVAQHAQALEERDGASQQLGVEGDDDGAKPNNDEHLGRLIYFCY